MTETKGYLDEDFKIKDFFILIYNNNIHQNSQFLIIRQALNLKDAINFFIKCYVKKNKSSLFKLNKLTNRNQDTII